MKWTNIIMITIMITIALMLFGAIIWGIVNEVDDYKIKKDFCKDKGGFFRNGDTCYINENGEYKTYGVIVIDKEVILAKK